MSIRQILSVLAVALIVLAAIPSIISAEVENSQQILIDYGNGNVQWIDADLQGSYLEITKKAVESAGLDMDSDTTVTRIGEFTNHDDNISVSWKLYIFENGKWTYEDTSPSQQCNGEIFAWGYYADTGEIICPVATPDHPSVWTTIGGSSEYTNVSDSYGPENLTTPPKWYFNENTGYQNSGIVSADEYIYFTTSGKSGEKPNLYCVDKNSGKIIWNFQYDIGNGNELTTPLILGDLIILCTTNGNIYCLDRFNKDLYWTEYISYDPPRDENGRPDWTGRTLISGPSTPAYDSGALYFGAADGKVYCYSIDKTGANCIWSYQTNGCIYYAKPTFATVNDERVLYIGNYEGYIYAFNAVSGELIWNKQAVDFTQEGKNVPGSVDSVSIGPDKLIVCCSDSQMSKEKGHMLMLDPATGEELWREEYLAGGPVILEDGFIFYHNFNVYKLNWNGDVVWKSKDVGQIKADLTESNGIVYGMGYSAGSPLISINANDGEIIQEIVLEPWTSTSFSMVQPTVLEGMIYVGNDGGYVYCISADGTLPPSSNGTEASYGFGHWSWYATFALVAAMGIILIYLLKFRDDSHLSAVKRKKKRFAYIAVFGSVITVIAFFISLSISSGGIIPISEAVSSLISAIQKTWNGLPLEQMELYIYNARLPRAIGAIAVGIGLSIAGCMYQAIIRNPLVDPYITGVSSGAGCIAVAAMAFGVTLPFISSGSNYVVPIAAIIGGVLAFAATMFIAEKSGGSSVNYILGGVIVGFAFSSIQTIFISLAGDKLHDVMYWLFGSFSSVTWENAWMIFVPAVGISLISMIWAREFNLVVLGEDEAKQMGLNVRRFNKIMLVIASMLTAICVAFVGIIGFVGLVVPHACRLLMGGDNRLVMPASIILGAMLMLCSDIIARMALMPLELPVGAITAIIGTPIFAYMLIKKGGNYDG